jgi:hypothetical protein
MLTMFTLFLLINVVNGNYIIQYICPCFFFFNHFKYDQWQVGGHTHHHMDVHSNFKFDLIINKVCVTCYKMKWKKKLQCLHNAAYHDLYWVKFGGKPYAMGSFSTRSKSTSGHYFAKIVLNGHLINDFLVVGCSL